MVARRKEYCAALTAYLVNRMLHYSVLSTLYLKSGYFLPQYLRRATIKPLRVDRR